jgi:Flp pilus assembly protein TadB
VLSYEENRRLAELERELAAEDPRLARILTEGFAGPPPGAVCRAVLAALAGAVVLILGVALELAVLTLAGYVLVYAAVLRYFFLRDADSTCP